MRPYLLASIVGVAIVIAVWSLSASNDDDGRRATGATAQSVDPGGREFVAPTSVSPELQRAFTAFARARRGTDELSQNETARLAGIPFEPAAQLARRVSQDAETRVFVVPADSHLCLAVQRAGQAGQTCTPRTPRSIAACPC